MANMIGAGLRKKVIEQATRLALVAVLALGLASCERGIGAELKERTRGQIASMERQYGVDLSYRNMKCYQYEPGVYRVLVEISRGDAGWSGWMWFHAYYRLDAGQWRSQMSLSPCLGC